jgi:signal transduction histidine kinase
LDALQDGIAVFGEDGRLRLSNPAFGTIFFGDDPSDRAIHIGAMADGARSVLTVESWRRGRDYLVEAVVSRKVTRLRAATRTGRMLAIDTVPLADGGALVAIYDVTDSHAVEQGLRQQAGTLQAVDRLKTEFLASLSYELRTPLTSIVGFADMLRAEIAGPLNGRQIEYLDDILTAANDFQDMVDAIIDVAAIEAGRTSLSQTSTPATEAISVATPEAAARLAPAPLNVAPLAEAGLVIEADPDRLRQILSRLLTVAGRYALDSAKVFVEAKSDGDSAVIAVSVGDPSTQGERSFGTDPACTAGASIDLNLAARLAQAHGGELIVDHAAPGILAARCRLPRSV